MRILSGLLCALIGTSSQLAWSAESRSATGEQVFQHWCVACHGEGPDKPGTGALQAKYKGRLPALLEKRSDLTEQLVKFYVRHGVSVMPPFRKTEISDADLTALATYLAHAHQ